MKLLCRSKMAAVLLIIAMIVPMFSCAVSAQGNAQIQQVVDKLASYPSEDRQFLVNLLIPLVITDTGLNALEYYVNSYNPEATDTFNVMIGKLMSFMDKETMLSMLGYLRIIEEGIREDYFAGFSQRKELALSESGQAAMQTIIGKQCDDYPGLEKIMTEDGITAGAIARLFEMPYKMNGEKPLLTDSGSGFAVLSISKALEDRVQMVISQESDCPFKSAKEAMDAFAAWLNTSADSSKILFKTILGEIGVYIPSSASMTPPPNTAGGAGSSGGSAEEDTIKITVNTTVEKDGTLVEIYEEKNGEKQPYRTFEDEQIIKIKTDDKSAMLYKADDTGYRAVRYSVYTGTELVCKISQTGNYKLFATVANFSDSDGWGKDYIESLYIRGIINGKTDTRFAPDDNITREEFVKLIIETAQIDISDKTGIFSDVENGAWYEKYVNTAYESGLVKGIDENNFGVGENITRQDMAKILYELMIKNNLIQSGGTLNFADNDDIADYATEAVASLAQNGVLAGDEAGNFNPRNNATRVEAAKLIYKLLEMYVIK